MPRGAFAGDFVNDAGAAFPAWRVRKPGLAQAGAVWLELKPAAFRWWWIFVLLLGGSVWERNKGAVSRGFHLGGLLFFFFLEEEGRVKAGLVTQLF